MPPYTLQILSTGHPLFPAVWQLREEVLRRPLGLSLHNEDLSAEVGDAIVAAVDKAEVVIGCVMIRPVDNESAKLRQMAVHPSWQGRGLGRALMREAEAWAEKQGLSFLKLHARQTAVPFYSSLGYEVEGAPFTEVGIPHLSMRKAL